MPADSYMFFFSAPPKHSQTWWAAAHSCVPIHSCHTNVCNGVRKEKKNTERERVEEKEKEEEDEMDASKELKLRNQLHKSHTARILQQTQTPS